ncbi:MAG: hypothetical protein H6Q71_1466 [Firmicutes bacterium]|nr:hypothetical protein [Bacillota bacterium]
MHILNINVEDLKFLSEQARKKEEQVINEYSQKLELAIKSGLYQKALEKLLIRAIQEQDKESAYLYSKMYFYAKLQ